MSSTVFSCKIHTITSQKISSIKKAIPIMNNENKNVQVHIIDILLP